MGQMTTEICPLPKTYVTNRPMSTMILHITQDPELYIKIISL